MSDRLPLAEPLTEEHRCAPMRFVLCWHVTLVHPTDGTRRMWTRNEDTVGARVNAEHEAGPGWRATAIEFGTSR